jgi:hypothetical protein
MLYREINGASSEIHTEHIDTLGGQKVRVFNVKCGGM